MWICSSCGHEERFQLFCFSCMAPGAQLWFQPHLCTCSSEGCPRAHVPCPGRQGQRWWWAEHASLLWEVPFLVSMETGVRGEGDWNCGSPPPVGHSAMVPCFFGGPGFFHEHSQLWSSLLPSLWAVSSQPTTVSSLCPLSKPHVPAPSPSPHQQTTTQAGACRAAEWNIHVGLNLAYLSQTSCCAFLQAPEAPPPSQLICPMVRGLPWVQEPLLSFSSPPGVQVPFCFFFSFLSPTQLCEDFSCPFRCPRSSASVQQALWELLHL